MVDIADLKSVGRKPVPVRVRPAVLFDGLRVVESFSLIDFMRRLGPYYGSLSMFEGWVIFSRILRWLSSGSFQNS
jgi:hypothetical protein